MTTQEALKRNEKSQWLKVWQVDDTWFYVESEDGKIAYKCCISDQGDYCNCGDFATRSKNDPQFKCKHILAVMNSIPRNEVLEAHFLDKRKPKLDESFIKEIDDKDFVLYGGLLDVAHQKNLCMVDVDLIQFPSEENKQTAICKAVVQTVDGKKFSDIGDANPINCNAKVAKHLIRMASTRAKARAFRDMDNIGMTCLEELGDLNDVITHEQRKPAQQKKDNVKPFPAKQAQAAQPGNGDGRKSKNENPIPSQDKVQVAVQPDTPVLPPAEAQADKAKVEGADTGSGKASKVPGKTRQAVKSGNGNDNDKAKPDKIPMMSDAQKSALFNLSRRRGISVEDLEKRVQEKYGIPVEQLSSTNAGEFIRSLQQSA